MAKSPDFPPGSPKKLDRDKLRSTAVDATFEEIPPKAPSAEAPAQIQHIPEVSLAPEAVVPEEVAPAVENTVLITPPPPGSETVIPEEAIPVNQGIPETLPEPVVETEPSTVGSEESIPHIGALSPSELASSSESAERSQDASPSTGPREYEAVWANEDHPFNEQTRKEFKDTMRAFLGKFDALKERVKDNFSQEYTKAKGKLTGRSEELEEKLDTELSASKKEGSEVPSEKSKKLSGFLHDRDLSVTEKLKVIGKVAGKEALATGEWYRKLPLRYKLAVSGALIGTSLLTGGASTLVTAALSTAKIGQRSLASAGVYSLAEALLEKRIANKEAKGGVRTKWDTWKKHGIASAAALAVFSGVPGYFLKEGFEAVGGGEAVSWLHDMVTGASHAPVSAEQLPASAFTMNPSLTDHTSLGTLGEQQTPDLTMNNIDPNHTVLHSPEPAVVEAPPAPAIEAITATKGMGYEKMLMALYNQIHEKNIDVSNMSSEVQTLMAADPSQMPALVHQLATEDKFFSTLEGSRFVHDGAVLSVQDGQIHFEDASHSSHLAFDHKVPTPPETASTAPAVSPEQPEAIQSTAPPTETPVAETVVPSGETSAPETAPVEAPAPETTPAEVAPPVESPAPETPHTVKPLEDGYPKGDVPPYTEAHPLVDDSVAGTTPDVSHPAEVASVQPSGVPTDPSYTLEHGDPFTNVHNVLVDPQHPSMYSYMHNGEKVVFVSGGGTGDDGFASRMNFIQKQVAGDSRFWGTKIYWDASEVKPDGSVSPAVGQFVIDSGGRVNIGQPTVWEQFFSKKMDLPDPKTQFLEKVIINPPRS